MILGSEDKGISRELISLSDHQVKIPMTGTIESLNVSVSAGILIYEIVRQRDHSRESVQVNIVASIQY